MERSQSCTNFSSYKSRNRSKCNNNNNNNNNRNVRDYNSMPSEVHSKLHTSLSSSDLLRIIHQRHLERLERAVSIENNHMEALLKATAKSSASQLGLGSTSSRRKRLQRQKSMVYSGDELEYAADLEENDDDDDDDDDADEDDDEMNNKKNICNAKELHLEHLERLMLPNGAAMSHLMDAKKKQVRFRQKQQSDSSLLLGLNKPIQSINSKLIKCYEKCGSSSSLNSSCTTSTTVSGHERRLKSDGSYDSVNDHISMPFNCGSYQIPNVFHHHHHNPSEPSENKNQQQRQQRQQRQQQQLQRNHSSRDSTIVHSDSSHYSSVDSLLEARKPDPEAILINLGFGPIGSEDILSRIPKRFLKPSQVRGINTEAFIKRLQLANSIADHSVLGYRGLTGNPDQPPSHIVAKIMQRFEVNERKKSLSSMELKLR